MNGDNHIPVLAAEVIDYLNIQREGLYVDCTIGPGGHALQILKRNPKASLIGFDIDEQSLFRAKKNLQSYAERVTLYHSDFRYLPDLHIDFSQVRGILLDLGLSSFQLDSPERGFSYNQEGPLDMRMDRRNKITASKIINKYSEHRLAQLFREFGEFRQSNRLAKIIISRRKVREIETTTDLRQMVEQITRWRPQRGKTHPAAKIFQALRIEVNQELKDLATFVEKTVHLLPRGARVVAISFHSLEDRIIKHTFAQMAGRGQAHPLLKILTKKPLVASQEEVASNFRARSAKLRAAERI
jgi:16S rRNA (cytosine1402-N4)-methyltransferase